LGVNQLTGSIPPELGNLSNLNNLGLNDNQLTGSIPTEIINLINLEYLRLQQNQFTELPDLSSLALLTDLQVQANKFTFEDIEPNVGITGIIYEPQAQIPGPGPLSLNEGDELNIEIPVGGSANEYQWVKDGVEIPGATTDKLVIENVTAADIGTYYLRITSPLAPLLTLRSDDVVVSITIVGIAENTLFKDVSIYPNPNQGSVTLDLGNLQKVSMNVFNIDGQSVYYKENITEPTYQFELNAAPGVYSLELNANGAKQYYKLIKN
jgi:hypothetical protein